jgi:hypothetical protein
MTATRSTGPDYMGLILPALALVTLIWWMMH